MALATAERVQSSSSTTSSSASVCLASPSIDPPGLLRRSAYREVEGGSTSERALDPNRAAMRLDDTLGDVQAEAEAPWPLAAAPVALEKQLLLLGSDARTGVTNRELHEVPACLRGD